MVSLPPTGEMGLNSAANGTSRWRPPPGRSRGECSQSDVWPAPAPRRGRRSAPTPVAQRCLQPQQRRRWANPSPRPPRAAMPQGGRLLSQWGAGGGTLRHGPTAKGSAARAQLHGQAQPSRANWRGSWCAAAAFCQARWADASIAVRMSTWRSSYASMPMSWKCSGRKSIVMSPRTKATCVTMRRSSG